MNWKVLAEKLIPVAAGATGNVAIIAAGDALEAAINGHINNLAAAQDITRDQVLSDAAAQWNKDVDDADALLKKGHEVGS